MRLEQNGAIGFPIVPATAEQEMLAFDGLGPRTRDALAKASVKFSAVEIFGMLTGQGLNPKDYRVDVSTAHWVEIGDQAVRRMKQNG